MDEQKGGWGHINVDQIEFSDMPGNRAVMALLEELLPARFSAVHPADEASVAQAVGGFENLVLQPGAAQTTSCRWPDLADPAGGKGHVWSSRRRQCLSRRKRD